MRQVFAGILTATLIASTAVAGPVQDGLAAANREDFATALRIWRPLADQGDAAAQYDLGFLYAAGQGVPQDYVQAYVWFDLAAANLAHAEARRLAAGLREGAARRMTAAQIAEARRLVREWKPVRP